MSSHVVKTPLLVQNLFPKRIWRFPESPNEIYLTFDDGPIPQVTPWVLAQLKAHNAKATFFCIGDNATQHPDILQQIRDEGHSIGNHTYNHLNGWATSSSHYVKNVQLAEGTLQLEAENKGTQILFRPPYGKIKNEQAKKLQKQGYAIVMWDVLSADFDVSLSAEKCYQNVVKNIQPGSIVVFHDSLKAHGNLKQVLPRVLDYIDECGWVCSSIIGPQK
ncbi:MAG: polysaccharide deacetylase family protein [Flavobacteriaceae bacterium]|nr:polysaccharide deacetylase family protein [Flavobacteriaceae bacterium]